MRIIVENIPERELWMFELNGDGSWADPSTDEASMSLEDVVSHIRDAVTPEMIRRMAASPEV